jgi:nucleotide-binding universal stress UspA family protein
MPPQEDDQHPRIVAGGDGSPSSLSALSWAIRQAALTGAAVDAVIAWHYPNLAASSGYGMAAGGIEPSYDFREIAEKTITDAISSTQNPGSDVRVRARVIEGNPVPTLLDISANADLLVVGSRGHGGFTAAPEAPICSA